MTISSMENFSRMTCLYFSLGRLAGQDVHRRPQYCREKATLWPMDATAGWIKSQNNLVKPTLQGCKSGEVLVAATFRPLGSQTLMEAPVTVEQVGIASNSNAEKQKFIKSRSKLFLITGDPGAGPAWPVLVFVWLWLLWWWGSRHQNPQQQDDWLHGQGFWIAKL